MVAPTVYTSADASAPSLTGQAGSLIGVLDACLVNGYGSKSAAGWTKEFSGTNVAAYRMGTGGSSRRMRLRIWDNGTNRANARGFDSMTDVDTGTEPFPTFAQIGGDGHAVWKSTTTDATARAWILVATPTFFYFVSPCSLTAGDPTSASGTQWGSLAFGEYISYIPSFDHNVIISGNSNTTPDINRGGGLGTRNGPSGLAPWGGHFICRPFSNTVGAADVPSQSSLGFFQNYGPFRLGISGDSVSNGNSAPDVVQGKAWAARLFIMQSDGATYSRIGRFPGLIVPNHPGFLGSPLDTINGAGALAGQTFLVVRVPCGGPSDTNTIGQVLINLTDMDS